MLRFVKFTFLILAALLLQVTLFPAYLRDPFKPNLLVILVAYLGLRQQSPMGGVVVFLLGLLQDCFSGLYLGLNAFTYLVTYIILRQIADRLYTDSRYLMILVVVLATFGNGLLQLPLLLLFSAAPGVYAALLPALLPQALVNALATSVLLAFTHRGGTVEQK